jgi:hypothetical protein
LKCAHPSRITALKRASKPEEEALAEPNLQNSETTNPQTKQDELKYSMQYNLQNEFSQRKPQQDLSQSSMANVTAP